MVPSKENCLKAQEALVKISQMIDYQRMEGEGEKPSEHVQFIGDFLASAAKRLPKQASLEKDKNRKRAKK